MAFFDCHFFSETLGLTCSAYVIVPQRPAEAGERTLHPTLWLLHGLSDDHTNWLRRTGIERYAAARNLAVVMPAVGRSFYQDMASGPRYWTFLTTELPALMRQFFPFSAERADNFTAGLSMGGYGALRMALAFPERFAAGASLSGALDYAGRLRRAPVTNSRVSPAEWRAIAGTDLSPGESDLNLLATRAAAQTERPALWLDCGTEDELLTASRDFHAHLDGLGYPHHYEERTGRHDWNYWDAQIQRVVEWLPLKA
jgi:S-formylglutathione hydrolase FrmB